MNWTLVQVKKKSLYSEFINGSCTEQPGFNYMGAKLGHMKFGAKTELENITANYMACMHCIRLKNWKDTVKFSVISPEPKEKDHFFCGQSNFYSLYLICMMYDMHTSSPLGCWNNKAASQNIVPIVLYYMAVQCIRKAVWLVAAWAGYFPWW